MRKLLFLIAIIPFSAFLQTDDIEVLSFGEKEGLVLSNIDCVVEDNDGFVWVGGSSDDLHVLKNVDKVLPIQRFDGVSFTSIHLPEQEDNYINVEQLIKRKDGSFFVLCRNSKESHLYVFDPLTTEFKRFYTGEEQYRSSKLFFFKSAYYFISQVEDVLSVKKITERDKVNVLFTFKENQTKYSIESTSIMLFLGDNIVISDDNFPLKVFNRKGELLKEYAKKDFSIPNRYLRKHIFIDQFKYNQAGCLFTLRYFDEEYQFSKDGLTISLSKEEKVDPTISQKSYVSDHNGNSLKVLELNNEIIISDGVQNEYKGLQMSFSLKSFYSSDLKKELWFGASDGFLSYVKFPSNKVRRYLQGASVRAIQEYNEKEVIVTTDRDGWWLLNKKTQKLKKLNFTNPVGDFNPEYTMELLFKEGKLWSSYGSDLAEIDTASCNMSLTKYYPATSLDFLNDSIIIYGTKYFNLMQYNVDTKEHMKLCLTDSLWIQDVEIIRGYILLATDKGLYGFDTSSNKLKLLSTNIIKSDNFFLVMKKCSNNEVLIGTKNGKIYKFNLDSEEFKLIYNDKKGAGIASINFDNDNNWWVNTFDGIVKFNPKVNGKENRFSTYHGLVHNESNRYSANSIDSMLYVGTVSGFSVFNPEDLVYKVDRSELVILSSRTFDTDENRFRLELNRRKLIDGMEFVLPATQRSIEIEFGIKNVDIGRNYLIEYRLDNNQWVSNGKSRDISFTNLASGTYKLDVKLSDFSGKQIGPVIHLAIVSEPFFYETFLFYFSLAMVLFLIAFWYVKELKKRGKLQEQFSHDLISYQENENNRISKELHDSVGQQLTLIKRIASENNHDEISKLTGSVLDEVRNMSRNLYPPLLSKFGLTETITELVNTIDAQTEIFFTLELDYIDGCFDEEQSLNVYRFFQESLSNVLKHANPKSVHVLIKKEKGKVRLKIQDDGLGFKNVNDLKLKSLGLKTLEERIRILDGKFLISSDINKGTSINAIIPVGN